MKRRVALLAGLVVALFGGSASAQPREAGAPAAAAIRVAVVPGVAVNVDAARVDALGQELADALVSELEVEAIGGLEVRRRLPTDGLAPDCVTTPACVADVAKRLSANQLLFVVMVETGGSIQVDSTWVDPVTGASTARPAIDLAVLTEARARFAASAKQLLPEARVRVRPATGGGGIHAAMSQEIPRHFTTTSYITAGAAVVGLGVGIGFGLRTKGLYDDCDQPTAPCSGAQEDKIRTRALIADLGYLTAIGGAVATAILFATSGSESRLVVAPSVEGTSGPGVSLTAVGRF
jgi:hypothetical protein